MIVTDSSAWERAAIRAAARGIEATWIKMAGQGHNVKEFWRTGSTSNPGTNHYVCLDYSAEGLAVICDCAAGQREVPCAHAAAVIEASQSMLEEPQEAPERPQSTAKGRYALAVLNGDADAAEREKALLSAD